MTWKRFFDEDVEWRSFPIFMRRRESTFQELS